jgi:hypothetical protein
MPSSILNSDDGVISGTSGLKSSGGDDGNLVFQSKGTETARINTDKQIVAAAGTASLPALTTTGDVNTGIFFPAADTIAFAEGGAEAMRIDSSGNVGIGTTSPGAKMEIRTAANGTQLVLTGTANRGLKISTTNPGGQNDSAVIYNAQDTETPSNATHIWQTGGTERARINPAGYFKASNNGSYTSTAGPYHEMVSSTTNDNTLVLTNSAASPYTLQMFFSGTTPNNTTNYFLLASDTTNTKAIIYSNGSFQSRANSYGGISDVKLKQDIVDAGSQWDDIKGLRVRKFRMKDEVATDPNYPAHLGLIAQEAELVSPGLVFESPDFEEVEVTDEEGNVTKQRNDLGTVTKSVKYSVLYMKAVKALQEAIERIETLEAKNDALEARIAALEAVPGNE